MKNLILITFAPAYNMTGFYKILLTVLLCSSTLYGMTQTIKPSVISTTGGTISDSTTTLTWTIGETVIQNIQSDSNFLSQGFQQPYYTIISSVENKSSFFDVRIFPNPSTDILNIIINSDYAIPIEIMLIDINGKTLFEKKENTGTKQYIFTYDTSPLATAVYFLKITNSEKNIYETFKIQKNH